MPATRRPRHRLRLLPRLPERRVVKSDPVDQVNARIYANLMKLLDGLNRAELCRKADVPETTLSAQLTKCRFTFELLAPLTKALGVTIGELADPPVREIPAKEAPRVLEEIQRVIERAKR